MLKFVGNGSAFNEKLGNNSAFILDRNNRELILIDCGSSVFHRLLELNLLEDIDKVNVIITHLHPDHVGSLGDLIFYNYYIKKIITQVYYPEDNIVHLLTLMDVDREFYNHIKDMEFGILDYKIRAIAQVHRGNQKAYGYLLENEDCTVFFSGDSKTINEEILLMLKNEELDLLYQDISSFDFDGNPHLSIDKLLQLIPMEKRHKVVCMHLDNNFNIQLAKNEGLSISSNILLY